MPPRVTAVEIIEGPPLVVRLTHKSVGTYDRELRTAVDIRNFMGSSSGMALTDAQRARLEQLAGLAEGQ